MTPQIFRDIDRGHIGNVRKQLSINPGALHATTPTVRCSRVASLDISVH